MHAPLLALPTQTKKVILVAALGYFVDIYDLILFGIVRNSSLMDLGLSGDALLKTGIFLLNLQMIGLLVGGILWGVLGDKRGRLSVLFGSIALYSVANLLNAFVQDTTSYAILRFIAGVGLAGELGAGITLAMETMSKHGRGMGAAIIAGFGVFGAVLAGFLGEFLDWRTCYFLGGIMGLILLFMRIGVLESNLFLQKQEGEIKSGNFLSLLASRARFSKYLYCIMAGMPIWYAIGILVILAPELAVSLGMTGEIMANRAIMALYSGLAVGDVLCGYLSNRWSSRRRAMRTFIIGLMGITLIYFSGVIQTPMLFYGLCALIGLCAGYWAVLVTNAAEQFGTNLRATVTTSVPNFVRGSLVPMTLVLGWLRPEIGLLPSAIIIGGIVFALGLWAVWRLPEPFGRDLDFRETDSAPPVILTPLGEEEPINTRPYIMNAHQGR
jgi:MFS transporter, putative metabolite:H+ symporter